MAKASEKSEQKANLYLLAIVAIVAVVGIVVLVLNSGGVSVSDDLAGQAARSIATQRATTGCRDVKLACAGAWVLNTGTGACDCIINGVRTGISAGRYDVTAGSVDAGACYCDPSCISCTPLSDGRCVCIGDIS